MIKEEDVTVVICAAGMGTRLGIGTTKALLKPCGKSLIALMLEYLKEYDDIRVVVGFQAEEVIEEVNRIRKDVMFVFNYDYKTTGPAASLSKALCKARKYIITLDGDLIVSPVDFKAFLACSNECVCISKSKSVLPIGVEIDNGCVIGFSSENTDYEWIGMAKIERDKLVEKDSCIYDMIKPSLPLKLLEIHAIDIDTVDDFENAAMWLKNNYLL